MEHFPSSDHKAVIAILDIDTCRRGMGLWKMNDSLLEDSFFIESTSDFIINEFNRLTLLNCFTKRMIWDLLKIAIRDKCISFVRNKKVDEWSDLLDYDIKKTSNLLASDPENKNALKHLINLNTKKEIKELAQARGALKRSRITYIEQGERNTRYFLNLERSNQANSVIKEVYDKNNALITEPDKVIFEIREFYTHLMNEPSAVEDINKGSAQFLNEYLRNSRHPTLNEGEKAQLDDPITIEELFLALKSLNQDSSPGSDGLTPLFYLTFWAQVKKPLFECFNESIENNSLSISQRRAIITLLPKCKGDELKYLKSWRPLSLTQTDYKLFSKVLANRLQKVIKNLINSSQVGYIAGRSINDHIRLIDDIINISNIDNIPGMVVSLDYQKAFDTVSKKAIITTLNRFNFGNNFIKYVSTLINDTEVSVKNNNWYTDWFSTGRGVRQGCCLSPLLFILVVEFLSVKIRENPNIEGLLDNTSEDFKKETKLLQYADDLSLFLKTPTCLTNALHDVDQFRIFSGLILNRNKSIGMWVGRNKGNPDGGEGLKWLKARENIKVLGTYFSAYTEASMIEENWNAKIESIKQLITNWSKRSISVWGKCLVAKTFLLSKINFAIQSLALPDNVINMVNNLIFKYMWRTDSNVNGYERVNRNTLCLSVQNGGLSMISIDDQQQVMLLRWLHRIHSKYKENHTHKRIVNRLLKHIGGLQYCYFCNSSLSLDQGLNQIRSVFWKKVIIAWLKFNHIFFTENMPLTHTPIFNNIIILHAKKPMFIKTWVTNGLKYVHQLFTNNRLKTYAEISMQVGTYGGLILDYLAVKNAVLKVFSHTHFNNIVDNEPEHLKHFDKLSNRDIRTKIVKQKRHTPKCIQLWSDRLNINITHYFGLGILASKESRLRTLHFKIIHGIYPTNILLNKMGIKESNKCDVCPEIDSLTHFFYECNALRDFWKYIETLLNTILGQMITVNNIIALFGIPSKDTRVTHKRLNEANAIIILAKVCISKYKYTNISNSLKFIFENECAMRAKHFTFLMDEV